MSCEGWSVTGKSLAGYVLLLLVVTSSLLFAALSDVAAIVATTEKLKREEYEVSTKSMYSGS